jgi:hypothetical protein
MLSDFCKLLEIGQISGALHCIVYADLVACYYDYVDIDLRADSFNDVVPWYIPLYADDALDTVNTFVHLLKLSNAIQALL